MLVRILHGYQYLHTSPTNPSITSPIISIVMTDIKFMNKLIWFDLTAHSWKRALTIVTFTASPWRCHRYILSNWRLSCTLLPIRGSISSSSHHRVWQIESSTNRQVNQFATTLAFTASILFSRKSWYGTRCKFLKSSHSLYVLYLE